MNKKYMKKLIAVLMALTMVMSLFVVSLASAEETTTTTATTAQEAPAAQETPAAAGESMTAKEGERGPCCNCHRCRCIELSGRHFLGQEIQRWQLVSCGRQIQHDQSQGDRRFPQ